MREVLLLFNFWGKKSVQSMAVVTPEWKYIHWYYGGDGMNPTDELFHLGKNCIDKWRTSRPTRNTRNNSR